MPEYLLGIDNGNTISKAAIFDLRGREIQVTGRKVESEYPRQGWTERSMDALWQGTAMTIKEALNTSGIKPEQIIGIGTTGHGNGLYLIDKKGRPVRSGIQSLDSRAADIIDKWNRNGLHDQVFPYTTQAFWPAQPNALLAWIKQNEPEVYQRIDVAVRFPLDERRDLSEALDSPVRLAGGRSVPLSTSNSTITRPAKCRRRCPRWPMPFRGSESSPRCWASSLPWGRSGVHPNRWA